MKKLIWLILAITSALSFACPPGMHLEPRPVTKWVCYSPNNCQWVVTTIDECVLDSMLPPTPFPHTVPATLSNLRMGDRVVVMQPTYLQIDTMIIASLTRGTRLYVERIHPNGWFYTRSPYDGRSGWVKIYDVAIEYR